MTGYKKRVKEIEILKKEIEFLLNLCFKDDETPKKIYKRQLKMKLWEAVQDEENKD